MKDKQSQQKTERNIMWYQDITYGGRRYTVNKKNNCCCTTAKGTIDMSFHTLDEMTK